MNPTQYLTLAALLAIGSFVSGCSAGNDELTAGLSIHGLTDNLSFAACSPQVLNVVSNSQVGADATYTWNINPPQDAEYSFAPDADELRFTAHTPGHYAISVTVCNHTGSVEETCEVSEFVVTVEVGTDSNANGIGDACEASSCTPACDDRTCGLDPVCHTSCGTCKTGETCDDGTGVCAPACVPACEGRTCGVDPICGQSCGSCGSGQVCDEAAGRCITACVPACDGRTCGLDPICNASCGTCEEGNTCNAQGRCETAHEPGRAITVVMALSNQRLGYTDPSFRQRFRLIEQSVRWVSPVANPKVLVVVDDNCSGCTRDADLVRYALTKRGTSATVQHEPARGLSADQLRGFDVVWLSSPDLPVDDAETIAQLIAFTKRGGGVVLQGDDITRNSLLEPLTQLRNVGNGKQYCGLYIDDNRGSSYSVVIERTTHPAVAGLSRNKYYYGDDIDASTLVTGSRATVLAWAQAGLCRRGATQCQKQPVIVAFDLAE